MIYEKCHEFKLWLFDINHNVPLCLWLVIGRKGVCHPVHHDTARLWRQASTRSTLFKFPLTEFCSSVSIASVSLDRGRVQAAVSHRIHCRETICWGLNFTCRDHGSVSRPTLLSFFTVHPLPPLPCYPQSLSQDPITMWYCQLKSCKALGSFLSSYLLWWFVHILAVKGETKHVIRAAPVTPANGVQWVCL